MAEEGESQSKQTSCLTRVCQPVLFGPVIWCLIVSGVFLGSGVWSLLKDEQDYISDIFYIAIGGVILVLEILSLIVRSKCCRRIECCTRCVTTISWFDTWKRGFVYILSGIIFLILINLSLFSILCGSSLIAGGVLYILKTCKLRKSATGDRNQLVEDFVEEQRADA